MKAIGNFFHESPQPDGLPSLRVLQPDPERDRGRVPVRSFLESPQAITT